MMADVLNRRNKIHHLNAEVGDTAAFGMATLTS